MPVFVFGTPLSCFPPPGLEAPPSVFELVSSSCFRPAISDALAFPLGFGSSCFSSLSACKAPVSPVGTRSSSFLAACESPGILFGFDFACAFPPLVCDDATSPFGTDPGCSFVAVREVPAPSLWTDFCFSFLVACGVSASPL